ncbi:hypothetical protein J6590_104393 [Homalodisca vitripennis]|nr:hypothetical protein J6590_104393 [Homalodisca vitripennis]
MKAVTQHNSATAFMYGENEKSMLLITPIVPDKIVVRSTVSHDPVTNISEPGNYEVRHASPPTTLHKNTGKSAGNCFRGIIDAMWGGGGDDFNTPDDERTLLLLSLRVNSP